MKTETKEIYKCDHCNKLYQIKRFVEQHEKRCYRNPNNQRKCFECMHMIKKDIEVNFDVPRGGEFSKILKLFYCCALKICLYPPKVEDKNNMVDLGSSYSNEPMRINCKNFESVYT